MTNESRQTQILAQAIIEETSRRLGDELPVRHRSPEGSDLTRMETVSPKTYRDARAIGDRFREGLPVIVNLSFIDEPTAKRLVDFMAGLVYSVRGSINRVTAKTFLLTPAAVVVDQPRGEELDVEALGNVVQLWPETGA